MTGLAHRAGGSAAADPGGGRASSLERDVCAVVALALGRPLAVSAVDWSRALTVARIERCAALCWLRGASTIVALAPASVVEAWRREALSAFNVARFWEGALGETLSVLEAAGVRPVILKGLPLSVRLYGDVMARPCNDIDLYVERDKRARAHHALCAAGVRWVKGDAPAEGTYRLSFEGQDAMLEVHSALLDGQFTAHLPFTAPESEPVELGGRRVRAHADAQLPAYLATHLATHRIRPLLWLVDFATLWRSLDDAGRRAASAVANRTRTMAYLAAAVRLTEGLEGAAAGDLAALRTLGFHRGVRREGHYVARLARLAGSQRDALRVVRAWLAPRIFRSAWPRIDAALVRDLLRKLAFAVRGIGQRYPDVEQATEKTPEQAPGEPLRPLRLSDEDFVAILSELTARNGSFWLVTSGSSMSPAIPTGSPVRLSKPAAGRCRLGDVVLAQLPDGAHVLHRIVRIDGALVTLRGDANRSCDPPIRTERVLAVAEEVLLEGRPVALSASSLVRSRLVVSDTLRGLAHTLRPSSRRPDPAARRS